MFTEVMGADFDLETPPIARLLEQRRSGSSEGSVGGDFLNTVVGSIDSLGLNTGAMLNVISFRDKKAVFKTEEGEIADYDGEVELKDVPEVPINFSSLREFAKFCAPLGINPAGSCFAETDELIYIVMPLRMS